MTDSKFFWSPIHLVIGLFSVLLIVGSQYQVVEQKKLERVLIPPPSMLAHVTMGYAEVFSDILWIRSLQDFDYCDQEIQKQVCRNNSWLYSMLDLITNLSPSFFHAYYYGGLALTIIITDVEGARRLYEKSVLQFPTNWKLQYHAAYHYIYEVKDKRRAAELLLLAAKHGAPSWVATLAGRLYTDSGQLDMANRVLQDMIDSNQDPKLIERLRNKIDAVKNQQQNR